MKPAATSLITTLSFLLWLSFTTTKPLTSQASASEQVLDINGDPIFPGREYYFVSATWGPLCGGPKPERTGDSSSCSYSVILERFDVMLGEPIRVRVPGISTGTISVGSFNAEIEFVKEPTGCADSSKLVIGGSKDHPQWSLVNGAFKIDQMGGLGYKLVFCTRFNFQASNSCYGVGIKYQDGKKHLVLKETEDESPFRVLFMKKDRVW
ncbi:kunitz-type serine protease inhibitor DrTI-like [Prosopis cineraria]|uniref:kunitz-type serine protease inhibitor DrTI-like n=1 Tax=Prosopis cineraria TaxID=364024 RepID=UPI00240EE8FE|nr:kunitz-type serine protease inhibitor DrTI-like [Prosopis cineraria]